MTARINFIQLRREILAQEAKVILPTMKATLNKRFENEKNELLRQFEDHGVTRELQAGPEANGKIANTQKGGNLFSLLGFVPEVDPVGEVRRILINEVTKGHVTREQKSRNRLVYNLEVRIPSFAEIKRKTELLLWTERSFIDIIENGIDNFKRYLFDASGRLKKYSRSGTAIQIKDHNMRDKALPKIPYVTELINDFKRRLGARK